MNDITIRHVISLCPRTQALIEQLAAALRSSAQTSMAGFSPATPSARVATAPQTAVPGVSGPDRTADLPPSAERPGSAAGGTRGEANALPPRTLSQAAIAAFIDDHDPGMRKESLRTDAETKYQRGASDGAVQTPISKGHAGNQRPLRAVPTPRQTAVPGGTITQQAATADVQRAAAGPAPTVMAGAGPPSTPSSPEFGAQRVWTLERKAILTRDYPAGVKTDEILRAVNALPGKPIERGRIAIKAGKMRLTRPAASAAATPPVGDADARWPRLIKGHEAFGVPDPAASAPPPPADPPPPPASMWTPERDAIVRSDIPTYTSMTDILSDLNMLPGPFVERQDVLARAAALGIARPVKAEPPSRRMASLNTIADRLG